MTQLFNLLNDDCAKDLAKSTVSVGDVYRIEMNKSNGIIPKSGDSSRHKFFVILGFDIDGNAYGGVIINSNINQNMPQTIKDWQMPIRCSKYDFLEHDSFVDCSKLKCASIEKFGMWQFKGCIEQDDIELIVDTIKSSPNETTGHLALYGL